MDIGSNNALLQLEKGEAVNIGRYSTRSKIAVLLLMLSVVDRGWVAKTHSAMVEEAAIASICLMRAAVYVGTALCYALRDKNDSLFSHMYAQEANQKPEAPSTPPSTSRRGTTVPTSMPPPCPAAASSHTQTSFEIPAYPRTSHYQSTTKPETLSLPHHDAVHQNMTIPADIERLAFKTTDTILTNWNASVQNNAQLPAYSVCLPIATTNESSAESRQWYTSECDPESVTYHTLDNQFYCAFGSSTRSHVTSKPWLDAAYEQQRERSAIHHNANLNTRIKNHINDFTQNGESLVYGSKLEQIAALLNCPYFQLPGATYGQYLAHTQRRLYARYFHYDGTLCPRALNDRSAAQKVFLKYPGYNLAHIQRFQKYCTSTTVSRCPNRIKKTRHLPDNITQRIHSSPCNQASVAIINAYAVNDMNTVQKLYNQNRANDIISQLYQQMSAEHAAAVKQQEATLKDAHGILHFNLPIAHRDPLLAALSSTTLTDIRRNSRALKNLNDLLIVRNHAKTILHTAWSIPHDAAPVVHQAMYALLNCHTIPERITTLCTLSSDTTKPQTEQLNLIDAFFLSNGILKDFAKYDRAQSFRAPLSIQHISHANTRYLLNHLVYAERIARDSNVKQSAAQAIAQIKDALAQKDTQKSNELLQSASALYSQIGNTQEEATPQPSPAPEDTPATPAEPVFEPPAAPESTRSHSSGDSGNIIPASLIEVLTPAPQNKHNKPKKVATTIIIAESVKKKTKQHITQALKQYDHNQSLPHCHIHNTRTYKGMHQIFPEETKGIILTPQQCDIAVKPFNYTVLSPADCGPQTPLWFNSPHLASPEIWQNCKTGELAVKGFHLDCLEKAQQSGLFKFDALERFSDKTYFAKWSYGNAPLKGSTFFPRHWTPSKMYAKVLEAIKNPSKYPERENKAINWTVNGTTKEGIPITAILEGNKLNNFNTTGQIISAYPTLEIYGK